MRKDRQALVHTPPARHLLTDASMSSLTRKNGSEEMAMVVKERREGESAGSFSARADRRDSLSVFFRSHRRLRERVRGEGRVPGLPFANVRGQGAC